MNIEVGQVRLWTRGRMMVVQVWTGTAWAEMPSVLSVALARADTKYPMGVATIEVLLDYEEAA
jgi:hypothetical protein